MSTTSANVRMTSRIRGVYVILPDGMTKRYECDEVQNDRLVDELKIFRNRKLIADFFTRHICGYEVVYETITEEMKCEED